MVERFFERLAAPVRGLHQAAYLLALLTLASQALALLRDRTFAHAFGAGQVLDLYYGAFRIPDLVFALVSSLVSAYVLIPRIAGASSEDTRKLLSESVTFLLVAGGIFCALLGVFAPTLLNFLYPSFAHSPYYGEFVSLARLLLLQPIILGISGIVTSVTQVHRRFVLFAISPVLYNLGIIIGTVFFYPRYGLPGIGVGVVIGALMHVSIHIPVLVNARVFPRLAWPHFASMKSIIRDSIPRSLALGMGSITLLLLTSIASRLGAGAVSVFTLAGNLEAVPLALIGSSYAVAAFPALSEYRAGGDTASFTRVLSASSRHIIVWSLLFFGLIVVLRAHLVRAILGSGAFDWNATKLTAALLAILAAGLIAQGLVLLFSRALYAAKESWWPFLYQLVGGALSVLLAVVFVSWGSHSHSLDFLAGLFRVSGAGNIRILLVALAATLGQFVLAIWSLVALKRAAPGLASALFAPLYQGAVAALFAGAFAYLVLMLEGGIAPLTTLVAVFTQGLVAGIVGLAAGAFALYLLGNREFLDVTGALANLARARGILSPSAEEPAQP